MHRTPPPKRNDNSNAPHMALHRNDSLPNQMETSVTSNDLHYFSQNAGVMQQQQGAYLPQPMHIIPAVYYNQSYQPTGTYLSQDTATGNQYLPQNQTFNQTYGSLVATIQTKKPAEVAQASQIEPGWNTVVYRKRQRLNDSPEVTKTKHKQTRLSDGWLSKPVETSNAFGALQENVNDKDHENANAEEIRKPPPIFIEGVENIQPLIDLLKICAPNGHTFKCLYNNQVKVQPNSSQNYTDIIKALTEKTTEFHTYQLKENRSFRVVVRNLHPTVDQTILKEEIEAKGHVVKNISCIRERTTKRLLPLFNIELKTNPNNKEIYEIKTLMNAIVSIEPQRPKREVPQCTRCQRFGHTQKYCQRRPRCVKCIEDHATADCPRKVRDGGVQCTNCNLKHPANFRGCSVYKELQAKAFPTLRKKQNSNPHNTPINSQSLPNMNSFPPLPINRNQTQQGPSYAQMSANVTNNQQPHLNPQQNQMPTVMPHQQQQPQNNLEQMLTKMMEKMDKMLDLLITMIGKM